MKNCEDYQKEISLMLDHELSQNKIVALNEHLNKCNDCKEIYISFQKLAHQTKEITYSFSIPSDFGNLVCQKVQNLNDKPNTFWLQAIALSLVFRATGGSDRLLFCSLQLRSLVDLGPCRRCHDGNKPQHFSG